MRWLGNPLTENQIIHRVNTQHYFVSLIGTFGWYTHVKPCLHVELNKCMMSCIISNITRYVDDTRRLKSPRPLSGASAHPTMVTLVNIMVMNGWLTSFSFHFSQQSHSRDKAISNPDLETPRSRSWVWSQGKVIQSAKYLIDSLPFYFTSTRPTIPEIQLFRNLTLKHPRLRSWVRSKIMVTYYTQYPTDAFTFRFTSIGTIIPKIWPN